jgi:hypothetical protein
VWKISLWAHLAESDHTKKQEDLLSSGCMVGKWEVTSFFRPLSVLAVIHSKTRQGFLRATSLAVSVFEPRAIHKKDEHFSESMPFRRSIILSCGNGSPYSALSQLALSRRLQLVLQIRKHTRTLRDGCTS